MSDKCKNCGGVFNSSDGTGKESTFKPGYCQLCSCLFAMKEVQDLKDFKKAIEEA